MNRTKIKVSEHPVSDLNPQQIAELKKYQAKAAQARGAYYSQSIADASRHFSELLLKHLQAGITYKQLSDVTGLQWRSIKSRLMRHGLVYTAPPSQEKKVFRGPQKPGPTCDHSKDRWRKRVNKKTGKVTHVECLDCRRNKRAERLAQQRQDAS